MQYSVTRVHHLLFLTVFPELIVCSLCSIIGCILCPYLKSFVFKHTLRPRLCDMMLQVRHLFPHITFTELVHFTQVLCGSYRDFSHFWDYIAGIFQAETSSSPGFLLKAHLEKCKQCNKEASL